MRRLELLVTCEHGGNRVPPEYRDAFAGDAAAAALDSHRGFDAGALEVARALAEAYRAPLVASDVTRLLVDLNRSRRHPKLYSEFSRGFSAERRRELLRAHYTPYRERVEVLVAAAVARGACVLHVSSHSFTPVLAGAVRAADAGLLYDPGRALEQRVAAAWAAVLREAAPGLRLRRNYPYRGVADGLTTALRKRFADADYAGLELEINQRRVAAPGWGADVGTVVRSLASVLAAGAPAAALAPRRADRRR